MRWHFFGKFAEPKGYLAKVRISLHTAKSQRIVFILKDIQEFPCIEEGRNICTMLYNVHFKDMLYRTFYGHVISYIVCTYYVNCMYVPTLHVDCT